MGDPPFDLSKFDPSTLDLSHLHPAEQNRIRNRQFNAQELSLLLSRQNPWTESGKPKPLPSPPKTPEADGPTATVNRGLMGIADDLKKQDEENQERLRRLVWGDTPEPDIPQAKIVSESESQPTEKTDNETPPEKFLRLHKNAQGDIEIQPYPPPESDEDRRLRKREELLSREESLQSQRWFDEMFGHEREQWFTKPAGFTPVGEASTEPRAQIDIPKPKSRSHVEWLWNGMAIVVVLLAAVFWGLLFVLAETFFAIGISRAPWFDKTSPRKRFLYKVSLITGIGIFLFIFWWFVPPPDIIGALTKVFGSKASPTSIPTPEAKPSPPSMLSSPSPPQPQTKKPLTVISGTATLSAGYIRVASAAVKATSRILVTGQDDNVSGTPRVTNIVPGVSFDIISTNGADDGKVFWVMYP